MGLCDEKPDELDLEVSEEGPGTAVVRATGEVDLLTAGRLRCALAHLVQQGRHLVVDLRGVRFMDASGIGALVGAQRLARDAGLTLTLRRPTPGVAKLLTLTGALLAVPVEP
jgi:anti-sigma B factor antagonist